MMNLHHLNRASVAGRRGPAIPQPALLSRELRALKAEARAAMAAVTSARRGHRRPP